MRRGSSMYSLTCDGVSGCLEAQSTWITYLDEESDRLAAVQETVVVGEGEVHHLFPRVSVIWSGYKSLPSVKEESYRANLNLAVHGHRLIFDGVETQNG